jgi:hypothetical protein
LKFAVFPWKPNLIFTIGPRQLWLKLDVPAHCAINLLFLQEPSRLLANISSSTLFDLALKILLAWLNPID